MKLLENFLAKTLPERVLILDEIEQESRLEAIPDLMSIFSASDRNDASQHAVGDTLRALLAQSEPETIAGLSSPDPELRTMCVQISGNSRFSGAVPRLLEMAREETNPELLVQILSSLAGFQATEGLPVFQAHLSHPDPIVAALCVGMLGTYQDHSSLPFLRQILEKAESDEEYESCGVVTEKAIEALGLLGSNEALGCLVAKVHHRNPTARRIVHQQIAGFGSRAVPMLGRFLQDGDTDHQILAANLLGTIGDRRGADLLVASLDRPGAVHPNVRFAVYEALGLIPSLKGLICLVDGLSDEDDMTLMAVVSSLDRQLNPSIAAKISAHAQADDPGRSRLLKAAVQARALEIFELLYQDPGCAAELIDRIIALRDTEAIEAFRAKLAEIGGERAAQDDQRLGQVGVAQTAKRLLAVDDSKSMLLFYKAVGADLQLDVTTAGHGREALDLLEQGNSFDVIITDLNMPVMDGIEFTRKVRGNFFFESIPVLMATTEGDGSQRDLAQKAGVTAFLNKPIKPDVLQEALGPYLG